MITGHREKLLILVIILSTTAWHNIKKYNKLYNILDFLLHHMNTHACTIIKKQVQVIIVLPTSIHANPAVLTLHVSFHLSHSKINGN